MEVVFQKLGAKAPSFFIPLLDKPGSFGKSVRYYFLIVIRARYGLLAASLLVIMALVVVLAAAFSARQLATVGMDVGFSYMRLTLPLFLVLLTQELLTKEFDRRIYLTSMTYSISRSAWFLKRLFVVMFCVFILLMAEAFLLLFLVKMVGAGYNQATKVSMGWEFWFSVVFVYADLMVFGSVAFLLSILASTPSFVLIGSLGFVLIARTYVPILQLMNDADYLVDNFADPRIYRESLGFLNFLVPDLSAFDVRMIALYNSWRFIPEHIYWVTFEALIFSLSLICFAMWRLNRREFY